MKKKVLVVLFTMAISMSLYACNKNTNETANNDGQNPPIETTTQEEESSTEIETLRQERGIEQFANKAGVYENEKSDTLVENGGNESLSSDGESLSVDGAGIDGEIQEGEYSQADNEETDTGDNNTNTKVNINPDSIPTSEIGAFLDSLTQEEIDAIDSDVLTELIYRDLYGDEPSSGSNHIPGNPVEGATPDNGEELPPSNFGSGGELPDHLKGDHIQ